MRKDQVHQAIEIKGQECPCGCEKFIITIDVSAEIVDAQNDVPIKGAMETVRIMITPTEARKTANRLMLAAMAASGAPKKIIELLQTLGDSLDREEDREEDYEEPESKHVH